MNVDEILERDFRTFGSVTIEPDGSVSVDGDVYILNRSIIELPLQFSTVSGLFDCSNCALTTLRGAPKIVGSGFYCRMETLLDLQYGPETVGGNYDTDVESLSYLPKSVIYFICTYCPNLNVLPLLHLKCDYMLVELDPMHSINKILRKYAGTGPKGILACAVELISAGYSSNAKL